MDDSPFANCSLIVFDLDGTLVDSMPGIVECLKATLDAQSVTYTDAEVNGLVGAPLIDIYTHFGARPEEVTAFVAHYQELYGERGIAGSTPYDGMAAAIKELQDAGHTLAVATSKLEMRAEAMLAAHKFDSYFNPVVGATLDGSRRHKKDLIAEVLARSGLKADNAVMIGDRDLDINGAKTTGLRSIGATWGYAVGNELEAAGADAIVASPKELVAALLG